MKQPEKKWNGILYDGGYADFKVNIEGIKNNPDIEAKKRLYFAYLLATNPEAFEIMFKDNIILLHGTNSNALPNILKYGMNSVDELEKMGINVLTGEAWSRQNGKRDFISFTDSLSTACGYASSGDSKGTFGILIGVSADSKEQLAITRIVGSDLPELTVKKNVPLEHIKMIAAPKSKVDYVRKLVEDSKINVVAVDIEDPFYWPDQDYSTMVTYLKNIKAKGKDNLKSNRNFSVENVKEFACKRMFTIISNVYKKVKDKSNSKGESGERDIR